MKVLVTGAAGFLGSHVCEWYRMGEHEVIALDNMTNYELKKSNYEAHSIRAYMLKYLESLGASIKIRDIRAGIKLDVPNDIDYIIHCAAQPTMTLSIENPRLDLETNVLGTYGALELARKLDCPIVNCSTIHIYGNGRNEELYEQKTRFVGLGTHISEDWDILNGDITPLHASKRSAEIYVDAFISTYGLKAANFRLTGMYGERQFAGIHHGWVSNFAIRTLFNRPMTIYGSDKQVRDILYAKDACRAFDRFYLHQKPGTYNIGGGIKNSISIRECLDLFRKLTGKEQDITFKPARFGDLWYFVCDISKAKEDLKWEPRIHYSVGLKRLLDWIKRNKQLFEVKA